MAVKTITAAPSGQNPPLPTTLYVRYTVNSIQIHALPAFASAVVCYIDIRAEDIVDEFARRHPRRLKLVDILS